MNFTIQMGKQFTHYAKGTLSFNFIKLQLLIGLLIQNLFHSVIYFLFNISFTVLFAIAKFIYLALEDGSPIFQQVFSHCTYYLKLFLFYRTYYLLWRLIVVSYKLILYFFFICNCNCYL